MDIYRVGLQGRCPHCRTTVVFAPIGKYNETAIQIAKKSFQLSNTACPACWDLISSLTIHENVESESGKTETKLQGKFLLWPRQAARPDPEEVPQHIAADYKEAALVLNLSPKASAALSRRCLQNVLIEAEGVKSKSLARQIDEVMPKLPSYIAESVDAIRNIGNFAAHPMKDTATGQIVDVEPGEAEWNLDVLDLLFDFYYVQPALIKQKRDALNAKLQAVKKPPVK